MWLGFISDLLIHFICYCLFTKNHNCHFLIGSTISHGRVNCLWRRRRKQCCPSSLKLSGTHHWYFADWQWQPEKDPRLTEPVTLLLLLLLLQSGCWGWNLESGKHTTIKQATITIGIITCLEMLATAMGDWLITPTTLWNVFHLNSSPLFVHLLSWTTSTDYQK